MASDGTKKLDGVPLRRQVLKDRVSDLIKSAILEGKLEPGDRIVEMKLAGDLGVATTSVREALFELESQGFVTRLVNRGTFVTQLSQNDIAEILTVRRELEGLAAELSEQRATPEGVAELKKTTDGMRAAATANDLVSFYRYDLEFHRTLWALSGNRHLAKALDITVVPLFAFFIMRNPSDSVAELLESVRWHEEIVEAIAARKNARQRLEAALRFFQEQENWLLFDRK